MKPLLTRLVAYLALLGVVVSLIFLATGFLSRDQRVGVVRLKHERLASTSRPRLILIGGSSLHYGMDSDFLQEELGLPVINMGIQLSLGLRFMLREVLPSIGQGDIVVVLAEPTAYTAVPLEGESTLATLISTSPNMIQHLTMKQRLHVIGSMGAAINDNLIRIIRSRGRPGSAMDQTNRFGDYIGHQGKNPSRSSFEELPTQKVDPKVTALLASYREKLKEKGAMMLIGYAPIARSCANLATLKAIHESIPPAIRVGTPSTYVFDDAYFYDSAHHLTFEHRRTRTKLLVRDLQNCPAFKEYQR